MRLSKFSRRLTAIIASALLLACQCVAVAHARALPATSAGGSAAQESCQEYGHGTGGASSDSGGYLTRCQSQAPSPPTPVEMNMLALVVSPAIPVATSPIAIDSGTIRPTGLWLAHVESPPLRILHCCLRN